MRPKFLTPSEIVQLTGRKMKMHQIKSLRRMGIPFFINAAGHPVVTWSALEVKSDTKVQPQLKWVPNVLTTRA
jgi:hypothetical protein